MNLFPSEQPNLDDFSFPYFFFCCNQKGVLTYVSKSVFQVLGYLQSEVVGKCYSEFLMQDDELNKGVDAKAERFGFNSPSQPQQIRAFASRQGDRRILAVQKAEKADKSGMMVRTQGIARDVTAQYEANRVLMRRLQYLESLREKLANREVAVLDLMVRGELNKSIARKLKVTERTIENVRARLKAKLCVETIAEVAAIATELRILPDLVSQFQFPAEVRPGFNGKAPKFSKPLGGPNAESRMSQWNCETN